MDKAAPSSTSPGLFARVARMMRGPGGETGLGGAPTSRSSAAPSPRETSAPSRPAIDRGPASLPPARPATLQRLVEAKQRNDRIRKSEFAYLRDARQTHSVSGRLRAGEPTFGFQLSQPALSESRATVLDKIDAIETEMSAQRWNR